MPSNGRSFDEGRRVLGLAFVEDSGEAISSLSSQAISAS